MKGNSEKVEQLLTKLRKKKEKCQQAEYEAAHRAHCPVCGQVFLSAHGLTYCSPQCKRRANYLQKRMRETGISDMNLMAAINDRIEHEKQFSREQALAASPDISRLVPVHIDRRTVVFIKPGQDPDKIREHFISKQINHEQQFFA